MASRSCPDGASSTAASIVEEMDTDAVLARKPAVALVDELAHTNAPGSARRSAGRTSNVLLDAGIDVVSTCNIQHLESVADAVATITGAPVNERIPDEVLAAADEVELVDMSPYRAAPADAPRQRLPGGSRRGSPSTASSPSRISPHSASWRCGSWPAGSTPSSRGSARRTSRTRSPSASWSSSTTSRATPRALRRAAAIAAVLRAPLLALVVETPADAGCVLGADASTCANTSTMRSTSAPRS